MSPSPSITTSLSSGLGSSNGSVSPDTSMIEAPFANVVFTGPEVPALQYEDSSQTLDDSGVCDCLQSTSSSMDSLSSSTSVTGCLHNTSNDSLSSSDASATNKSDYSIEYCNSSQTHDMSGVYDIPRSMVPGGGDIAPVHHIARIYLSL